MSKRVVLWIAFVVVHLQVAALGFVLPNQPMGDVVGVYDPWSQRALGGWGIVGINEPWVYPQLALAPMLLAQALAWLISYPWSWALLVTVLDALVFAVLLGRGRSVSRVWASWFWLAALLALGPVGMYRLDGLTVPLALAGCLWLIPRPWLGSVLLAAAIWIKVWPAALIAAAVISLRSRRTVIAASLVVSSVVLITVIIAGGGANALGFITGQTSRGLQIEAPISSFYLWMTALGVPGVELYYDGDLLTFQMRGPGVPDVVAAMTPVLVIAAAVVLALGVWAHQHGARAMQLFPALAFSLVLVLIVFNKVGSPQFHSWLIVPVMIGILWDRQRWKMPAVLTLAAILLTQWVYPLTYHLLLQINPATIALLTVRNLLLCALLGWAVVRLAHVGRSARERIHAV